MRHHILPFPFCVDVQYIPVSFFLKTSSAAPQKVDTERWKTDGK